MGGDNCESGWVRRSGRQADRGRRKPQVGSLDMDVAELVLGRQWTTLSLSFGSWPLEGLGEAWNGSETTNKVSGKGAKGTP